MSRLLDPDARIRAFLDEGRTELSDRAYDAVRAGIDRTRQRIVIGPLAEPRVPSIATFAIGAAAVLIVGAIGLATIAERSPGGAGSGSTGSQVRSEWLSDDSVAFTVQREPGDDGAYYWRAVTYDRLDLRGASVRALPTPSTGRPARPSSKARPTTRREPARGASRSPSSPAVSLSRRSCRRRRRSRSTRRPT